MRIETKIKLNRYQPRPYQLPIIDAIENKGYKRVLAIFPRRCLSGNTHITMDNGSFKLLKDIVVGDKILSWSGESFESDTVKNIWSTGIKKTCKVQSPCYLPLISSHNHVFAHTGRSGTTVSWDEIQNLGKHRVTLNYAGCNYGSISNSDLAEFWGFMLSDGYVAHYQQPKFTNINIDILKRVEYLALKLFDVDVIWRPKGNGFDLGFSNRTLGGGSTSNPIKELFRTEGADVQKSQRKLPESLWNLDTESLYSFFRSLISSDGSIYCQKKSFEPSNTKRTVPPGVEITLSCGKSDDYSWGIYWLLRKIGIVPQIPYKERGSNWKIKVSKSSAVRKLLSSGPIYGKEEIQKEALFSIKECFKETKVIKGCFRSLSKIDESEEEELYDLESTINHNFIANGYLVHNSGKDVTAWNLMIRAALNEVGVYFYCAPTYSQGRKIIWDSITSEGVKFLDYIPAELIERKNDQQMKIHFINGSLLQVIGSDAYDTSLVGSNPRAIVFTEWALSDPRAYQFSRPILTANGGWALFIGTPRGKNHMWETYQIAKNSRDWFACKLTIDDTHHISYSEIERERRSGEMSEDLIQQEYYTSFDMGVEGAFYAKYLDKMRNSGQIGIVPWEPSFPVFTAWDIGVRDSTTIILYQAIGQIVRIIDCYENSKEGLEHYVQFLQSKEYTYAKHFAPHDIAVKEWGSGMTRIEKARQLGIKFQTVSNLPIMDGIESVRSAFARIWIDQTKCMPLLKALENYRQEYDSVRGVYKPHPLHDKNSHFADAMRYLCLSLPKTKDGLSAEDLDKRYKETMLGGPSLPWMFNNKR